MTTCKDKNFRYVYEGFYQSFAEARKVSHGFESERWLESQRQLIEDIRRADWHSRLPLDQNLATVIAALDSNTSAPVRVLDIGGGLGGTFLWLKQVLSGAISFDYTVLELDTTVALAAGLGLSDEYPELRFTARLPGAEFTVVYFGSSLQYFEDSQKILVDSVGQNTSVVVMSRIPVCEQGGYVTLQNYYDSKIPLNVIGLADLEKWMGELGFTAILKNASCTPILGEYQPIPVNKIPEEYAIGFCTDLVFRKLS
jgi:putative methyltransferase (TIGR04325 family)